MTINQYVNNTKSRINEICKASGRNKEEVTIVGVTKYVDPIMANEIIEAGISHIGENRLEKLREKQQVLTDEFIKWHFIGTLQKRKVKEVIPHIDYLHSLDRLSLAEEIQKRADKPLKCFLQVKTSYEETKQGVEQEEAIALVKELQAFDKIEIVGLMTMAPNTDSTDEIRKCFRSLREIRNEIQNLHQKNAPCTELSMGMSNDFEIAIEEGATFIRLGSILFGK